MQRYLLSRKQGGTSGSSSMLRRGEREKQLRVRWGQATEALCFSAAILKWIENEWEPHRKPLTWPKWDITKAYIQLSPENRKKGRDFSSKINKQTLELIGFRFHWTEFQLPGYWERVRTVTTIRKLGDRNDDWVWMFSCQYEVQRVVWLDVESPEFGIGVIYIEGWGS